MAADLNERIAQWEKMTAEAPDDMAWFSLGNAYKDAERFDDAARAYGQAIQCNPTMSRAYQLQGQVLIQQGKKDEATSILTDGFAIAAGRGDLMPQKAIGALLEKIGAPVPQIETQDAAPQVDPDDPNTVIDRRTGRPGQRLPDPPMRGPLGQYIYDHYSQETWREWIGQGTKVINELRLDFANAQHRDTYDAHMIEWLGIDMEAVKQQEQATQSQQ